MFKNAVRRLPLIGVVAALLPLAGCPGLFPPAPEVPEQLPASESETDRSLKNNAPRADAGEDQTVAPGALVVLNGTGSSDEDGDRLLYYWRLTSTGGEVELNGRFSALPTFRAPEDVATPMQYTFRLEVSDGFAFNAAEVTVTVTP